MRTLNKDQCRRVAGGDNAPPASRRHLALPSEAGARLRWMPRHLPGAPGSRLS